MIPDFGGFLVKANSEGQPGPQDYKRTHADGANMLADAVAPHGGIVMWRAFVYSNDVPVDRIKQAYDEFMPLDGTFRDNVLVQVKNGPLDFQPREPFHPLFGAMPKTPLMMEFQITKEYLGQDTHLAYLAPTVRGSAGCRHVRGRTRAPPSRRWWTAASHGYRAHGHRRRREHRDAIATGRARTSTRRTGTPTAGWPGTPALTSARHRRRVDPDDVVTNDPAVVATIRAIMMGSREAVVNYMTPLGLAHIMAERAPLRTRALGAPGPAPTGRPTYYHRADSTGIGFDRTADGQQRDRAVRAAASRRSFARPDSPDESVLLWFHHVRLGRRACASGRTLWDELVHRYHGGRRLRARDAAGVGRRCAAAVDDERHRRRRCSSSRSRRRRRAGGATRRCSTSRRSRIDRSRPDYEPPAHPLRST